MMKKAFLIFSAMLLVLSSCKTTTHYSRDGLNLNVENSSKDITSFSISGSVGVIDDTDISVTVPYGTAKTNLTPTITVSSGASVSPASGIEQNFTAPVLYTVTGGDGTTKEYTVTVTVATSHDKDITALSILGVVGTIGNNTIAITLPIGTDRSSLIPTITYTGVSISPASGVAKNFMSPVTYTVTAPDNTTKNYVVTATIATLAAGSKTAFTADGVSFNMAYVPGGFTFPTGFYDDGAPATVADAYWIGETEVTYELWYKVRTWAIANGYTFANTGREGKLGVDGAAPTAAKDQPVTFVGWRDAIVFGNALTEWYNAKAGTSYTCAYYSDAALTTPIRTALDEESICSTPGCQDDPFIKADASGFRVPESNEWELAARYKDGTSWTYGTWASGATADYNDATATQLVDWYSLNSSNVTHAVKGKLPNALGLYDMSGNVWEWNFEYRDPSNPEDVTRLIRGGSWKWNNYMQVGNENDGATPWFAYHDVGFRFVRTDL